MLCGVAWPVGLREAFLTAVLPSQEAPADFAAQRVVHSSVSSASLQSFLEMQNHGLTSVLLNQNLHFNEILEVHWHMKVWEVLVYTLLLFRIPLCARGHFLMCNRSMTPLWYSPALMPLCQHPSAA